MLTIREIIKTLYSALLQRVKKYRGNWNQNDPTADDYIKNRPFYTDETKKTVNVPEQKITIPSVNPFAPLVLPELIEFAVGQTYKVKWDNKTYSCVAFDMDGIGVIGNQGVFGNGTDTGEPFIMMISKAEGMGMVAAPEAIGTHTVEVTSTKIVKLDKKYLPDLGLAPVATSGNYWDLEDIPTDVVRYGAQYLTNTQKAQVRTNIGAVGYEAQTLTNAQKQQARANIGAGTSNFDGNYNNLTNKPTLATVATSGSYNDLTNKPDIPTNVSQLNNDSGYATETYVDDKVASMVDSAPEALDTLNELAAALGDDPNFATTVLTQVGNKANVGHIHDISDVSGLQESINGPKSALTLIDQVNGYAYFVCMRDGNIVSYCATESISVTTMPDKTKYGVGEYFDPTGMVITAVAYDGTTKEITEYTYQDEPIAEGATFVEVFYVENGASHVVNVPISILTVADILVDFEYTDNGDGTYTITGWKGTYNGVESTEIIIPDYDWIIV